MVHLSSRWFTSAVNGCPPSNECSLRTRQPEQWERISYADDGTVQTCHGPAHLPRHINRQAVFRNLRSSPETTLGSADDATVNARTDSAQAAMHVWAGPGSSCDRRLRRPYRRARESAGPGRGTTETNNVCVLPAWPTSPAPRRHYKETIEAGLVSRYRYPEPTC
jgi:hypothetical protein